MDEQYYLFVDKTGHCFEDFQSMKVDSKRQGRYNDYVGALFRKGRKFTVGDMMAFRDDLTQAGFRWGIDFYVKKVDKD